MVQKIFYLLQNAGYPTELEYFLHYYGPYSEDLSSFLRYASTSEPKLLDEEELPVGVGGVRFDYSVTESAERLVSALEAKMIGPEDIEKAKGFCEIAQSLNARHATDLELAATILYFQKERGCSRDEAIAKTRAMKPAKADEANLTTAQAILDSIAEQVR